eukprot:6213608-Pleurochrysis_carterae.AAC.9
MGFVLIRDAATTRAMAYGILHTCTCLANEYSHMLVYFSLTDCGAYFSVSMFTTVSVRPTLQEAKSFSWGKASPNSDCGYIQTNRVVVYIDVMLLWASCKLLQSATTHNS